MARRSSVLDLYPFTDIGRRERQEDYFYTGPPARDGQPWLGVLADGMGGHECGEVASQEGVHAVRLAFEGADDKGRDVGRRLADATRQGHEAVLRAAEKAGAAGNMGSTVVAFVVDGPTLHWCSAGDSRLYLFRGGKLVQLTQDFTVAEDMRRSPARGEWSTEEIDASPQRNALTSFMGTDEWRADTGSRALQDQDVVVACSDGVYGTVQNEGIAAACASLDGRATARQVAEDLQRRVRDAGKSNQDNATAIVLRYGQVGAGAGGVLPWAAGAGVGVVAVAAVVGVLVRTSDKPAEQTVADAGRPAVVAVTGPSAASAVASPQATAPATAAMPAVAPPQGSLAALPAPASASVSQAPQQPAPPPHTSNPAAPAGVANAAAPRTQEAARPTPAVSTKKEDEALVRQIEALRLEVEGLITNSRKKGTITPEAAMKRAKELLAKLAASGLSNQASSRKRLEAMHAEAWKKRLEWNLGHAKDLEKNTKNGSAAALNYLRKSVIPLLQELDRMTPEAAAIVGPLGEDADRYYQALRQKRPGVRATSGSEEGKSGASAPEASPGAGSGAVTAPVVNAEVQLPPGAPAAAASAASP